MASVVGGGRGARAQVLSAARQVALLSMMHVCRRNGGVALPKGRAALLPYREGKRRWIGELFHICTLLQ